MEPVTKRVVNKQKIEIENIFKKIFKSLRSISVNFYNWIEGKNWMKKTPCTFPRPASSRNLITAPVLNQNADCTLQNLLS